MRVLGQRLGVEAMSLYDHVANKDDILDGMLELVISGIDLPTGDVDWRVAMRRRAASARAVFGRHPWASALNDCPREHRSRKAVLLRLGDRRAASGRVLHRAGPPRVLGDRRLHLRLRTSAAQHGHHEGTFEESAETILSAIPAGEFPYLAEVITDVMLTVGYDEAADFEFGLGLILDGLERASRTDATDRDPASRPDAPSTPSPAPPTRET